MMCDSNTKRRETNSDRKFARPENRVLGMEVNNVSPILLYIKIDHGPKQVQKVLEHTDTANLKALGIR